MTARKYDLNSWQNLSDQEALFLQIEISKLNLKSMLKDVKITQITWSTIK